MCIRDSAYAGDAEAIAANCARCFAGAVLVLLTAAPLGRALFRGEAPSAEDAPLELIGEAALGGAGRRGACWVTVARGAPAAASSDAVVAPAPPVEEGVALRVLEGGGYRENPAEPPLPRPGDVIEVQCRDRRRRWIAAEVLAAAPPPRAAAGDAEVTCALRWSEERAAAAVGGSIALRLHSGPNWRFRERRGTVPS